MLCGALVSRSAEKPALVLERCRDTAKADRGLIVPAYDKDLVTLVKENLKDASSLSFNVLWKRFRDVVSWPCELAMPPGVHAGQTLDSPAVAHHLCGRLLRITA